MMNKLNNSSRDEDIIELMLEKGKQLAQDFPKDWYTWFHANVYEADPDDSDYIDFYLEMTRED